MSNITTSTTISGDNIHVKLQSNSEYRRFFFQRSSKFSELYEKIKLVLGLNEDFIVKYKDEEGEWITISSDMELETGLILSNGTLFRLHISLSHQMEKKVETEKVETEEECGDEKPWKRRCKGKWRKWRKWNEDSDEENEDFRSRRFRGRGCRGGRGKWRKWNEERKDGETKGEEKEPECDKKEWKRMKKEKRRMKKMEEDGESSSETNSGDALLSLEEIKKNLEKLKQDLGLLKEKKKSAKGEIKDIKHKLKEKRDNESTDIEGIAALTKTFKEKKQTFLTIFKELKLTKFKIKKLRDLAESKTV